MKYKLQPDGFKFVKGIDMLAVEKIKDLTWSQCVLVRKARVNTKTAMKGISKGKLNQSKLVSVMTNHLSEKD